MNLTIFILIYIIGLGILTYMLILLANFLRAGRKAFDVYVENNKDKNE